MVPTFSIPKFTQFGIFGLKISHLATRFYSLRTFYDGAVARAAPSKNDSSKKVSQAAEFFCNDRC
jgi:hypothetical protein